MSAASSVQRLAKPNMRGMFERFVAKTLALAVVGSAAGGILYQVGIRGPNKERQVQYYAKFNAQKEYERQKNLGLFQRVRPDDESKAVYPTW